MPWSIKDMPSQAGKLAVVTGATGGLGLETAFELARAGAEVVLTGRNAEKGAAALTRIRSELPQALVSYESLDLSGLANVARFAETFAARHDRLDILINNAGVMAYPRRQQSVDGFELQFATNYLGHFALTGHLLPLLGGGRVVSLSSIAARDGAINFADLQYETGYSGWPAYNQTKLACLMFGFELQRRSARNGWGVTSIAAHPGISATGLVMNGPGSGNVLEAAVARVGRFAVGILGQSAERGALPQLYAATAPDARGGGYYGPDGIGEFRGNVSEATPPAAALDFAVASRLWEVSQDLTGTPFPALSQAA